MFSFSFTCSMFKKSGLNKLSPMYFLLICTMKTNMRSSVNKREKYMSNGDGNLSKLILFLIEFYSHSSLAFTQLELGGSFRRISSAAGRRYENNHTCVNKYM